MANRPRKKSHMGANNALPPGVDKKAIVYARGHGLGKKVDTLSCNIEHLLILFFVGTQTRQGQEIKGPSLCARETNPECGA